MGKTARGRITLIRRRHFNRKSIKIKKDVIIVSGICFFVAVVAVLLGILLPTTDQTYIIATNNNRDIPNNEEGVADENSNMLSSIKNTEQTNSDRVEDSEGIELCLLGEIMMGGSVTSNLNYVYTTAFKDIHAITKSADFTFADFSTNITNLEKIENAKSKYLVTKEVVSGLNAIGIDAVSLANDHITDYPKEIISNTINILEKNEINVAGREDAPVYLQKGDKKIAIIATNSIYIGTKSKYSESGISTYEIKKISKLIEEAKSQADFVMINIHWGRESEYGVTDTMRTVAKAVIDAGADMVVGSHALGIYPVVTYKSKPIIYSTGYFMSDADSMLAKENFIFKVKITEEMKLNSIEMIPILIENKEIVRLYSEVNISKTRELLNLYNRYNLENGIDTKVFGNRIVMNF